MLKTIKNLHLKSIDEYLSRVPEEIREKLEQFREVIKQTMPQAEELISYEIPTFSFMGVLVTFAAFKNHIGFYPRVSGIEAFKKELAGYKQAKASVQFPINKPLPLGLITQIVKFRMDENAE